MKVSHQFAERLAEMLAAGRFQGIGMMANVKEK
jgi:hypothetical protein